jgi:hypothetical protein
MQGFTQYGQVPEEARAVLEPLYKPFNEQLFQLLGTRFQW